MGELWFLLCVADQADVMPRSVATDERRLRVLWAVHFWAPAEGTTRESMEVECQGVNAKSGLLICMISVEEDEVLRTFSFEVLLVRI